ncbi:hypothetical protein DRH27_04205 [Candidatus Falkowbacteria bacterium]|nr:MAG: hypothetical protein DRH27_04205 [Candidatus Falkowbacteria bacterium]
MSKPKSLSCKTCDDDINEDSYEVWTDGKAVFCSCDCLARWYGEELTLSDEDEYAQALKDYGEGK